MSDVKHVMLIIETSKAHGRAMLKGIGRYALMHGRWSVYIEDRGLLERPHNWLSKWRGDGIIFRSTFPHRVEAILKTGVPAVDTNSRVLGHGLPLVYPDEKKIAEVSARHFLERGFQNFAFCAHETQNWVQWRRTAYLDYLKPHCPDVLCLVLKEQYSWDEQQQRLARWVASLPKPAAVLAANDVCGMRLLDACRSADIRVPEEIAVLGVGNDEIFCNLTLPALSSVNTNSEQTGYEAAGLLDKLMAGDPPPPNPLWVKPSGVVTRQSTDIIAIDDPELVQAISFIRKNACIGINVADVLNHVAVSRATLERRFASTLNCSPKEEILRIRLERVKCLLAETDLTLPRIAELSGFKTHSHMSVAFKRANRQTVGQYRLSLRPETRLTRNDKQ
jgi:LacI family transcriptional regulator